MTIEISLLISGISMAFAIFFGISNIRRNQKADMAAEARRDATVLTEIGYIKANTDEIKLEQKEQRKTNSDFADRLVIVEQSTKQAHRRIDEQICRKGD